MYVHTWRFQLNMSGWLQGQWCLHECYCCFLLTLLCATLILCWTVHLVAVWQHLHKWKYLAKCKCLAMFSKMLLFLTAPSNSSWIVASTQMLSNAFNSSVTHRVPFPILHTGFSTPTAHFSTGDQFFVSLLNMFAVTLLPNWRGRVGVGAYKHIGYQVIHTHTTEMKLVTSLKAVSSHVPTSKGGLKKQIFNCFEEMWSQVYFASRLVAGLRSRMWTG